MGTKTAGGVLLVAGVLLFVVSAALTFSTVGATTAVSHAGGPGNAAARSAGGASGGSVAGGAGGAVAGSPAAEGPRQFVSELSDALRSGNTTFLLSRLDPAVISLASVPTCTAHLQRIAGPASTLTFVSTGATADYLYHEGTQSVVVPHTVSVTVTAVYNGQSATEAIHIAMQPTGTYDWFTDCTKG